MDAINFIVLMVKETICGISWKYGNMRYYLLTVDVNNACKMENGSQNYQTYGPQVPELSFKDMSVKYHV